MSSEQSSGRTNKGFALILGAAQVAGLSAPHSNDAILAENGVEFFWIHPFAHVDDRFIGQINNTPRSVVNLEMGDTVTFVKNEIVDRMYLDAGRMKGNHTARAILRSALPRDRKAFMRRLGLDFEF